MKPVSFCILFMLLCGLNGRAQGEKAVLVPYNLPSELSDDYIGSENKTFKELNILWKLLGHGNEDSIFFELGRYVRTVEGTAFNFHVFHYRSEAFVKDTACFRSTGTSFIPLDVVGRWDVSALAEEAGKSRKKFGRTDFSVVLGSLTGGKFRAEAGELHGRSPFSANYSGLIPYSYDGKPCFLLWDEGMKETKSFLPNEFSRSGLGGVVYNLPTRFEDAEQMVLCRYSENCYVLLLLTRPMVAMD